MDTKKVVILPSIFSLLLFAMVSGVVIGLGSEETWEVYDLEYAGLRVRIEAPRQVDPGENITVTIRAEAPLDDVYVDYIYVTIYSLKNETDEIPIETITHLEASKLAFHEVHKVDYVITIPNDTSAGLTYGIIQCKWEFQNAPEKIPPAGFVLTYVRNSELEQLRAEYDEFMANYTSLLGNYTELDSKYAGELGGARNLMYVFVATTIIAVGTILFLIIRRPKTFWS